MTKRMVNYWGEVHHNAKLTAKQVEEIRKRLADGGTLRGIAKEFGVGPSAIANIKLGRTWRN